MVPYAEEKITQSRNEGLTIVNGICGLKEVKGRNDIRKR